VDSTITKQYLQSVPDLTRSATFLAMVSTSSTGVPSSGCADLEQGMGGPAGALHDKRDLNSFGTRWFYARSVNIGLVWYLYIASGYAGSRRNDAPQCRYPRQSPLRRFAAARIVSDSQEEAVKISRTTRTGTLMIALAVATAALSGTGRAAPKPAEDKCETALKRIKRSEEDTTRCRKAASKLRGDLDKRLADVRCFLTQLGETTDALMDMGSADQAIRLAEKQLEGFDALARGNVMTSADRAAYFARLEMLASYYFDKGEFGPASTSSNLV